MKPIIILEQINNSTLEVLTLGVISIFISVFIIIRIDYRCYKYATILGIDDNED